MVDHGRDRGRPDAQVRSRQSGQGSLRPRPRRRLLLALGVLVAAWGALSLVLFTWSPWAGEAPRHADAVIVLSGGRDRLPPALALVRRGVAPVLAISSVSRTKPWRLGRQVCAAGHVGRAAGLWFPAKPSTTPGEAPKPPGPPRPRPGAGTP